MADSILKLKVDNQEYDSKLKRATDSLQRYVDGCRKAGGTLAVVEDETLKFVKSLGEMDTVAKGGQQSLREMTRSITDLTIQYRSLTDEEKKSPFGQAMAASIQTLTERAGQARDAMQDVNAAIQHAASDTRIFDQIAGAAGLTTASFQTLQGAAKLLGVDLGDNVEVIAKLQAAMAVTNGLTQIQNTLQKESAVMQGVAALQTKAHAAAQALLAKNTTMATAAGKAFNAVANANPYVLIASAVIVAGTALVAFSKNSKEATDTIKANQDAIDRAKKINESYSQTLSSNYADLMSKYDKLKRAWLSLGDTHQKQQWIKENEKAFADLGLSINSVQSAEDAFEHNTGKIVDSFKRRAQAAALAAKMVDMYKQQMDLQQQANDRAQSIKATPYHTFVARENEPSEGFIPDAEPDQYGRTTYNQGRYTRIGNSTRFVYTAQGAEEFNKTLADIDPVLKQLKKDYQYNDNLLQQYNNQLSALETGLTSTLASTVKKEAPTDMPPVGSIADLTQKMQDLKTAQSLVTNNDDWIKYQQQIEQIQYQIDALKGTWKDGLQATFTIDADDTEALAKISEIQGATIADKTVMVTAHNAEALAQLAEIQGVTISDKSITVEADNTEALAKLGKIEGVTIADKTVMVIAHNAEALAQLAEIQGVTITDKTVTVQADDTEALAKISEIQGATIADKTVMVTAHNAEALAQLAEIQGVTISDKSITVEADNTEALAKLGKIEGVTIADKTVMVIAHNAEALAQLAEIQGVTITDKTVTVQADDTEALSKLGEIEGVTIADKTVMVTAHNAEALAQLAEIQGVTITDKTVTVQAQTAEAYNEIVKLTQNINGTTVTFNVKPDIDRSIGKSITNSAGLNDFISSIKKLLQDADFGSDLYQSLSEKLADATMLQNLVKESLSVGLGTTLFEIADETGQDFWDRVLSPEGVENADWQAIADVINQKRKELGLDAITLDFGSGKVSSKVGNEQIDVSKQVVSGLSQVSTGLSQMGVQIPDGITKAIGAMQGLMSVIEGMKTITEILRSSTMASAIGSETANTSALTANTTAIMALTAAMATDTALEGTEAVMTAVKIAAVATMANGGIVPHAANGYVIPGTHYSGDTTPIMANAGELVLNRAQQGNLASQLEDSRPNAPAQSKPYVTGQDIYLGLTNYLMGAGMGQLLTTKSKS